MSTVSGGLIPNNFSTASGPSFLAAFASVSQINNISVSGVSTLPGGDVLTSTGLSVTVSGTAVTDNSSGGNSITTLNPASVFLQTGDTISSAAATTVFGANSGPSSFALSGANSSVTGGAGFLTGTASGANTTLVGGTGGGNFTVSGSGSLAVAGQAPGTTTITLAETTGGAQIATNPLGNSGTLIATLSATGADTVVGGGGASTIHGGGGDDVFGFVSGHAGGTEVITGFTTSDTFAFKGYGYSLTNAPTETVTGGNDVITLTDGTQITLVGIDHKIF